MVDACEVAVCSEAACFVAGRLTLGFVKHTLERWVDSQTCRHGEDIVRAHYLEDTSASNRERKVEYCLLIPADCSCEEELRVWVERECETLEAR